MAFCNWCQLESETPDVCAWCKRPLARNATVYSSYGDSVSLLREDGGEGADRATVVIGGLIAAAFFAVVVYAAITYSGGSKAHRSNDPLSTVAESERTWTGDRPAAPVTAPASTPAISAPTPPTRQATRIQPSTTRPPVSSGDGQTQAGPLGGASISSPAGFAAHDGEASPNGVHIESTRLSSDLQKNGNYTIHGTIELSNVSGYRAYALEFYFVVGKVRIRMVTGTDDDLGNGLKRSFTVKSVDVEPDVAQSPDAAVHVFATTDGGKVADSLNLGGS